MYLQPLDGLVSEKNAQSRYARRGEGIFKRQNTARNATLAGIAFAVLLVSAVVICLVWRSHSSGTKSQKKKARWFGIGSRGTYEQANSLNDIEDSTTTSRRRLTVRFGPSANRASANNGSTGANNGGIDRNTSVRSVMTLPAYRQDAGESEQVIGREGERDGVDVVIELPTAEEEEEMRENEMAALYELRLARREQIEEREERRRERRDARARGDTAALRAIQERTRAASNSTTLDERRREHERLKTERQRAVSSVAYGDLGVARHDGTRIRAASVESERVGLLSDAASIAATSTHSGVHQRHASQTSILTMDSDIPSPNYRRSNEGSRPHTPRLNTSTSSPDLNVDTPTHSPPGYDDVSLDDRSTHATPHDEPPPDYPGPAQQRASRIAAEMATAAAGERASTHSGSEPDSPGRSASGAPQLPELQVSSLPRIVVEPSSARP